MKQSLYAKSQQSDLLTLPTPAGLAQVKPPEQESYSNYLVFMHRDKGKWSDVKAKIPDIGDGDAVLFSGGEPRRINPLVFFLIDMQQYWCVLDAEFKPRKTWLVKPEERNVNGARINEVLSVAAVLQHQGEMIPATIRFSNAMAKGVYTARLAADEAASPDWAKKSPDHAATMTIPQPNLRYKTHLEWRVKKSRGGYSYFLSSATILPTSSGDALAFKTLATEGKEEIRLMLEAFNAHKQDIENLAK